MAKSCTLHSDQHISPDNPYILSGHYRVFPAYQMSKTASSSAIRVADADGV